MNFATVIILFLSKKVLKTIHEKNVVFQSNLAKVLIEHSKDSVRTIDRVKQNGKHTEHLTM